METNKSEPIRQGSGDYVEPQITPPPEVERLVAKAFPAGEATLIRLLKILGKQKTT